MQIEKRNTNRSFTAIPKAKHTMATSLQLQLHINERVPRKQSLKTINIIFDIAKATKCVEVF